MGLHSRLALIHTDTEIQTIQQEWYLFFNFFFDSSAPESTEHAPFEMVSTIQYVQRASLLLRLCQYCGRSVPMRQTRPQHWITTRYKTSSTELGSLSAIINGYSEVCPKLSRVVFHVTGLIDRILTTNPISHCPVSLRLPSFAELLLSIGSPRCVQGLPID